MSYLHDRLEDLYYQAVGHPGKTIHFFEDRLVVDCHQCGYIHLWPCRELDQPYYDSVRYRQETGRPHASRYGEELADQAWHDLQWDERLAGMVRILSGRRGRSLLDVGSGYGFFMARAITHGWQVTGVEPATLLENPENLPRPQYADILDLPSLAHFDAVHISYVLEHVCNPEAMLFKARDILHVGGVLCVAVPNDASLLKRGETFVLREEHVNYFSHESIHRLVSRCGFAVRDQWASFPFEWFLKAGIRYDNYPRLGHALHHARMVLERGMAWMGLNGLKLAVYRCLAGQGAGRASVLLAVREV